MIPVKIELVRHLLHHRPDDCHVEVGIIHRLVSSEIFVANVAAADDGDLPVHRERLVMHPLVEASDIGDDAEQPGRT